MSKGLQIPLSLNPRDWTRGLKIVSNDLDDLRRDLDRVEDAADDTGEGIEDAFTEAGRKAKKVMDDMADDARRSGRQVGDNIDAGIDEGVDRGAIGEVGAETAGEFVESWGEAIRSGDPASAVTETITNAAQIGGAAGPVGAAIGLGVAAAGGLAMGWYQKMKEQQQNITDSVTVTFDAVNEAELAGGKAAQAFARGFVNQEDAMESLQTALGAETWGEAVSTIDDMAQDTGIKVETITSALLGNSDALDAIRAGWEDIEDPTQVQEDAVNRILSTGQARATQLAEQNGLMDTQAGVMGAISDDMSETADKSGKIKTPDFSSTADDLERAAKASKDMYDNVANLPENKTVNVTYKGKTYTHDEAAFLAEPGFTGFRD